MLVLEVYSVKVPSEVVQVAGEKFCALGRSAERAWERFWRACARDSPNFLTLNQTCARPPSTNTSLPVIKLLSSEARNKATAAVSSGFPTRSSGA